MSFTTVPGCALSEKMLRRCVLLAIVLVSTTAMTPSATLRQAADRAGLLVGSAVRPYLFSEAAYTETLDREFNLIEPEDAMKWWTIRRSADAFDFRDGDEVVQFAQLHGMKVRGHCLVWDHNNPEWLARGNFTTVQISQMLHEHITTVVRHYAGQVFAWDVVNEGLDENGRLKDSLWYNRPGIGLAGTSYIEQAFRWAHEADPRALLFYNDNGGEELGRKSDAIYAMVKDFKQRGIPIDGVGLQMHISSLSINAQALSANLARLTALGLQVHITEMDVALPLNAAGQPRPEDLAHQAEVYRAVFRACLANPGCTAIQTWGFTDKYSWIGSHSHGSQGAALPFDRFYQPKGAYAAMIEQLASSDDKSPANKR